MVPNCNLCVLTVNLHTRNITVCCDRLALALFALEQSVVCAVTKRCHVGNQVLFEAQMTALKFLLFSLRNLPKNVSVIQHLPGSASDDQSHSAPKSMTSGVTVKITRHDPGELREVPACFSLKKIFANLQMYKLTLLYWITLCE